MKNEYIDAYIFGPNDLSGSIGQLGHMYCEENMDLVSRASEILRKHNKNFGVAITDNREETLRFWKEKFGMNIFASGADYVHILNGSQTTIDNINKVIGKRNNGEHRKTVPVLYSHLLWLRFLAA